MSNIRLILIALILCSAAISAFQLAGRSINQLLHPAPMPLHSLAAQFEGLKPVFANMPAAGYYTDKDLELPLAVAQYEQAQYVLAPTVLKINDLSHPLTIFDCTTPEVAKAKIESEGLKPILANNTGIIVAVRQ